MNTRTHRTIYNQSRGCLMAVAETAKSSGKASGESRPTSKQTRRKARFTWSLRSLGIAVAIGLQAMLLLPCSYAASASQPQQGLQASSHSTSINSLPLAKESPNYAPSQLGTDPVAPLLAFSGTSLAIGVSPQLFGASQNITITNTQAQRIALGGSNYINQSSSTDIGSTLTAGGNLGISASKAITGTAATLNATGNVNLDAVDSVTLLAGRNTSTFDSQITTGSSGIGNRKESIDTKGSTSTATGTSITGDNVTIQSKEGNIVLQAADITANQTLTLNATNGVVALLSATNQNYFQIDKKSSDFALQRMSGSGNFDQTTVTTQLKYGTLSIDTNKIIADLPASKAADELAKQPGMGWINDIQNNPALAGKVDWKSIDEAHKNWSYDKTTMTPAMASLVTIALAVATGGAGATLVGATSAIGGAVASAAFTSLVTQATIGLINNGGDLGKTLSDLGSKESIRGLVTSMATAAAMSYVNSMDFMKEMTAGPNGLPVKFADLDFAQKLGVSVTNAATGAVTRTALNGGSLGDALVTAIGSGLTTALAAQGANSLHLSPDQQGDLMAQVGNKLGHALIGCAAAKANSSGNNCQAGAMGAVIGETAAEMLAKSPAEVDAMNAKERQAYESSLVNTTKLISASIAAAAGLDPNAAAIASSNAVENNLLSVRQVLAAGKDAANCIASGSLSCLANVGAATRKLDKEQDAAFASGVKKGFSEKLESLENLPEGVSKMAKMVADDPLGAGKVLGQAIAQLPAALYKDYTDKLAAVMVAFYEGGTKEFEAAGKALAQLSVDVGVAVATGGVVAVGEKVTVATLAQAGKALDAAATAAANALTKLPVLGNTGRVITAADASAAGLSTIERNLISKLAGSADEVVIGNGAAPAVRLPQDVNVSPTTPKLLEPLSNRTVGTSATQNAVMQADVAYLENIGATNIRINQQQLGSDLCRIGSCRPDVQARLPDGRMVYIEYDTAASARGLDHAARLNSNDPKAIVILKRVN